MNSQDRSELERLKRKLESLRHEFDLLWMQTQQLEARAGQIDTPAPFSVPEAKPLEITPSTLPPLVSRESANPPDGLPDRPGSASSKALRLAQPPSMPPVIPSPPAAVFDRELNAGSAALPASESQSPADIPPAEPPRIPLETGSPMPLPASFEMKLGTYWLVRIGIVMLLTGMVFLGNLAYQKYHARLGPPERVALLYLASGVLLGVGAWLQRKQESLKNYSQVLLAGGLAAVYFTTYAAHHIENLKVIPSGVLDGLLLLSWAGFMAWLADRKKSELLALFAVGLAYYTSIITNVGLFTLYSNLVLTAAAVFFFIRNRWAALSFGSLLATYGGYAYWRFYVEGQWLWHLNLSNTDFQLGNLFLLGYWLLFTVAVFLSRHEKFAGEPRAAFLTINNAAFFGLVVLARLFIHSGSFWKFSLLFGGVLLGLAALARRRFENERLVSNSYLTQGLVLVTLGVMTYFTGLKLAVVLAAESVILLILADQRGNLILRVGAFLTAALAAGWAVFGMQQFNQPDLYLGAGVGALLAFNAWWSRHHDVAAEESPARPQPAFFSTLALLIWAVTTWNNTSRENLPLLLAVEAVLFTASFHAVRVPEIPLLGQFYLILAQVVRLLETLDSHPMRPWWNPALLIAITAGLSHWWQRQKKLKLDEQGSQLFQVLFSLAAVGLLYLWLQPLFTAQVWLAFTGLLAVSLTVYGVITRAWPLAAAGQLFLLASGFEFARQLWLGQPPWHLALAPIAALAVLSFGTVRWFSNPPEAQSDSAVSILQLAVVYRWVALLMSLAWICEYVSARERVWILSLVGAIVFWWSGWRKNREGLIASAVFTATGLFLFWFPIQGGPTVYFLNFLAILLLLGQQRMARRLPEHYHLDQSWHTVMILLGGITLWRLVSQWVMLLQSEGFYLTVAWAMLALVLFVAGLVWRERIYRWLGLGVLGCAVGRVVIFDVWKLETLYRILSFMALGIVLLVLGFLYNKYQEKIREWL